MSLDVLLWLPTPPSRVAPASGLLQLLRTAMRMLQRLLRSKELLVPPSRMQSHSMNTKHKRGAP